MVVYRFPFGCRSRVKEMTPSEKYEAIILRIARSRYVTVEAIRGKSRDRHVYMARQEVANTLYNLGLNMVQIGRYVNRDPTTVLNMLGRLGKNHKKRGRPSKQDNPSHTNKPTDYCGAQFPV